MVIFGNANAAALGVDTFGMLFCCRSKDARLLPRKLLDLQPKRKQRKNVLLRKRRQRKNALLPRRRQKRNVSQPRRRRRKNASQPKRRQRKSG